AVVVARLHAFRYVTGQNYIRQAVARDVRLDPAAERTVADDDQAGLGDAHAHGAIRPQQIAKALALFEPSNKQDVEVLVAQVPDGRQARTVDVEIDTVGDDAQREIGEVALHERAGRLADRDAAMQMREVRLEQRPAVEVTDVGSRKSMKRSDVGRGRHPQHGDRQGRHQGLVEMKDVEALVGDDRGDLVGKVKAERDARHRIVDRDGDRRPDPVEARAVEVDIGAARRREDARLMAELSQPDGEAADMVVNTTWRREVVRRNEPDLHAETPRGVQAGF